MSLLDAALVAIVVANVALGVLAGGLSGALRLLGSLVALALWFVVGGWLGGALAERGPYAGVVAIAVSGLFAMTAASALAGLVASRLVPWVRDRPPLSRLDHALGVLPGAAWGLSAAYAVAWIVCQGLPPTPLARALIAAGQGPALALQAAVPPSWPGLAVTPEGLVVVGAAPAVATPPAQLERQMLDLVNQERKQARLKPLAWDDALARVARSRSRDLLARNYFAHTDPSGHTVAFYAAKAGVRYATLGENLAFAPDLATAHRGLMLSPGHRENILRPAFGRVGIGIIRLGPHDRYAPKVPANAEGTPGRIAPGSLLVTQIFRD